MSLKTLLYGLGIGAGLMYFYDPERGDNRRAMVRDQINQTVNNVQGDWKAGVEDLRNRTQGMAATVKSSSQSVGQGNQQMMDTNLTPGIRLLMEAGGGLLALYGMLRKGLIGTTLSITGLGLVARGVTNMDFRTMLGMGRASQGIDIEKAININAPVNELYDFWTHFDNFPKFMKHVVEVKDIGNNRTHWIVKGPAGTNVEWDAITTMMEPNKEIDWESTPDSEVKSTGRVQFRENSNGSTRITVHMTYLPPAGAVGHAVATLLGSNPRQEMNDDLMRLKSLFEEGKTTVKDRTVTRQDLPNRPAQTGA
jgi:uncharacterized membrane protein